MIRCPAELRDLLISLVDGTLTEEEHEHLSALLQADSAAREYYLRFLDLHGRLELMASEPLDAPALKVPLELPQKPSTGNLIAPRDIAVSVWQGISCASPARVGVVFALLVISLSLALLALWRLPEFRRDHVPVARVPLFPVATLTNTDRCQWKGNSPQLGDAISSGTVLHLQSGAAEVTFLNGARMRLQGGSIVALESMDSCRLELGRVSARAPGASAGFTVHTPLASVIDMGTEFSVAVDQDGATETHVLEGLVGFQPRSDDTSVGEMQLIAAGQAARLAKDHNGYLKIEQIGFDRRSISPELPHVVRVAAHHAGGLIRSDSAVLAGGNSAGTRRIGSSSETGTGLGIVLLFRLPALGTDQFIATANLEMTAISVDSEPSFNVDLYGLGYVKSPVVGPNWFFEGMEDRSLRADLLTGQGDLLIERLAAGLLTPARSTGKVNVENESIKQFLHSVYENGAQGGDLVVFRLNADQRTADVSPQTGYNVVHPPLVAGRIVEQLPHLTLRLGTKSKQKANSRESAVLHKRSFQKPQG